MTSYLSLQLYIEIRYRKIDNATYYSRPSHKVYHIVTSGKHASTQGEVQRYHLSAFTGVAHYSPLSGKNAIMQLAPRSHCAHPKVLYS